MNDDTQLMHRLRQDLKSHRRKRLQLGVGLGLMMLLGIVSTIELMRNFQVYVAQFFTNSLGQRIELDWVIGISIVCSSIGLWATKYWLGTWIDDIKKSNQHYQQAKLDYDECVGKLKGGELSYAPIQEQQGQLTQSIQPGQLSEKP